MHLQVIPPSFPAVVASATSICFDNLRQRIISTFSEVFSDYIGTQPIKVSPMSIYCKDAEI